MSVVAVAGTIGPDARWLDALGGAIVRRGGVPDGIPFATAPSRGWSNAPVLAEVAFHGFTSLFGDDGLLVAQIAAVAVSVALVSRDARRSGATDGGVAVALFLLLSGGLLGLVAIRAQLFSLALFPAVVLLLRAESRRPSRRIWLLVPALALWSNLHGAVLIGFLVALAYLALERMRLRPLESVGVACAGVLAVCATPALAGTPGYYVDVATSEAARRGIGLWAPLSLRSGFDLLLVAAAAVLLAAFALSRPRAWEAVAALGLAALTIHAARNGVWLLLFLTAPAATAMTIRRKVRPAVAHCLLLVLACVTAFGLVRGPLTIGASAKVEDEAIAAAKGAPILAEPALAEQLAADGARVWISNPLDAFRRSDQRAYLDWLDGRAAGDRLVASHRVVVVQRDSGADRRLRANSSFRIVAADSRARIYVPAVAQP